MCAGALSGTFMGIKKSTEYGDTTATKSSSLLLC